MIYHPKILLFDCLSAVLGIADPKKSSDQSKNLPQNFKYSQIFY